MYFVCFCCHRCLWPVDGQHLNKLAEAFGPKACILLCGRQNLLIPAPGEEFTPSLPRSAGCYLAKLLLNGVHRAMLGVFAGLVWPTVLKSNLLEPFRVTFEF